MKLLKALLFATAVTGAGGRAHAQGAEQDCELHIWPTSSFNAVSQGMNLSGAMQGDYSGQLSPRDEMQAILAKTAASDFQQSAITEMNIGAGGRFAGYRIIFHDAPIEPSYQNWIASDVGAGARNTDSASHCYAELHLLFITYFRAILSKSIQTGFLFRDFGAEPQATRWAADASSTGVPRGFPPRSSDEIEQAQLGLKGSFQQNLRTFLGGRRMRRLQPAAGH